MQGQCSGDCDAGIVQWGWGRGRRDSAAVVEMQAQYSWGLGCRNSTVGVGTQEQYREVGMQRKCSGDQNMGSGKHSHAGSLPRVELSCCTASAKDHETILVKK